MPLTSIQLHFNEAVDPSSLGLDDLMLSMGEVTNVTALDSDSVQYTLQGITEEETSGVRALEPVLLLTRSATLGQRTRAASF